MAKTVGFLCPLKLEWLDRVVDLVIEGMETENIREALNDYISLELKSPDNIRKTRESLMKLWVYPFADENVNIFRKQAIDAIKDGEKNRIALHWCMLLICYPVFSDVAEMIGKIMNMQESFSLAWLKGKMAEHWGERATLLRSVEKVMQTMKQMGVLCSEKGIYTINQTKIEDDFTKKVIIKTILALKIKAYYEPSELANIPQMFPFEYSIDSELIFGSQEFRLGNFGNSPVVVGENH